MERRKTIKRKLLELGVPAHLAGFPMVAEAVETWMDYEPNKPRMVVDIYGPLGAKYECGICAAERRMRHAIEVAAKKPTDEFAAVFHRMEGRPVVSEFIGTVAQLLAMEVES